MIFHVSFQITKKTMFYDSFSRLQPNTGKKTVSKKCLPFLNKKRVNSTF